MIKKPKLYFLVFVLPTLIAFCIAFLVPFIMGVALSFTKFNVVTDATFTGFDNYIKAFTDPDKTFVNAMWFSTKFTVVTIISVNIIAFALAMLLTRGHKGTNVFRTVFFMPNLIGGIVLGYIWQTILNGLLQAIAGVDLMYDAQYGFWGMVILTNWQLIGYMMIIYIAGIQNVPGDLMEAASIDGASKLQTLFKVTIPMVMPSITICTFLTLTNAFKMFDQNLALTSGGPDGQTRMLALDIYQTFYNRQGWSGVGQAKAVVFFLLIAAIAFIQLRITRSKEVEG